MKQHARKPKRVGTSHAAASWALCPVAPSPACTHRVGARVQQHAHDVDGPGACRKLQRRHTCKRKRTMPLSLSLFEFSHDAIEANQHLPRQARDKQKGKIQE